MRTILPGIYAILEQGNFASLLALGRRLLQLPISALQIRAKSLSAFERCKLAQTLAEEVSLSAFKPLLVINDDLELAQELGAALHLGQEDLALSEARKRLDVQIPIGISTHDLAQAIQAQESGAHYIGYGPIHETTSKKAALSPRNPSELIRVVEKISIPIVAIGGLHANNLDPLLAVGIRHFAFLSALHRDTSENLSRLIEKIRGFAGCP